MTPEIKQAALDVLGGHTRRGGPDSGWNEPNHCTCGKWNSDSSRTTFTEHLLAKLDKVGVIAKPEPPAPEPQQPRVWFMDEAPETGALVMDSGGSVRRWNWDEVTNEREEEGEVYNANLEPLVEVLIQVPNYAEAVADAIVRWTGGVGQGEASE